MANLNDQTYPKEHLRFVFCEGDSTDNTYHYLKQFKDEYFSSATLIQFNHGLPNYGSIEHPEKHKILSMVFNAMLEKAIEEYNDWADYYFILPTDTSFDSNLIEKLVAHDKEYIAPMYYYKHNNRVIFYDLWGFWKEGKPFPPREKEFFLRKYPVPIIEMDYVGGPALMAKRIFDYGARYTPKKVDHEICDKAKDLGIKIYAAMDIEVYHTNPWG